MADTVRTISDEKEYFESNKQLNGKIKKLAKLVRNCKHFIIFTGAGVSTSCGIPDFRSGVDTKLDTGPGIWAKQAAELTGKQVKRPKKVVKMLSALPSLSHMSMVELQNKGILKFIISQNVDGIHLKSGIKSNNLAELHGNTNLEICKECNIKYLRDCSVRAMSIVSQDVNDHKTGRYCDICKSELQDTIINFGETLPVDELKKAEYHSNKGDLCLVLGSSLTVNPAASFAELFGQHRNKKLCIVNIQKTPLDKYCDIRIFAKCDDVMKILMNQLGYNIPEWKLNRYLEINMNRMNNNINEYELIVSGIELDRTPASYMKCVIFRNGNDMQFVGDIDKSLLDSNEAKISGDEQFRILFNIINDKIGKQFGKRKKDKKRFKVYVKYIFDAGFDTIDKMKEFRMDEATEILIDSNNYERRLFVDNFSESRITFVPWNLIQKGKFNVHNDFNHYMGNNKFEIELEFAKHYNEPNLVISNHIQNLHKKYNKIYGLTIYLTKILKEYIGINIARTVAEFAVSNENIISYLQLSFNTKTGKWIVTNADKAFLMK